MRQKIIVQDRRTIISNNAMTATDIISSKVKRGDVLSGSDSVGEMASHNESPMLSTAIEQYGSTWYMLSAMLICGFVRTQS